MARIRFTPRALGGPEVPCSGCRYKQPCGQPSTYTHFCGPGIYYSCSECATRLRRAELDSELKAMGAHVIQVKDLEAALEARACGGLAIHLGTCPDLWPETRAAFSRNDAIRAAHLARVALGEVASP